jgi:hypothetical protein
MTLNKKEEHEQNVFLELAQVAELKIVFDSLKSCSPPEPDILVIENKLPRYFELGRLSDTHFTETQLNAFNNPGTFVRPSKKVGYPIRDMLVKKVSTPYQTYNLPVDLILYYDYNPSELHVSGIAPDWEFEHEVKGVIEPVLKKYNIQFDRIWYFERFQQKILFQYQK